MSNNQLAIREEDLPDIVRKRGIPVETWNALKNSIFRGAGDEMVITAMDYCKARKLDPLKKPVHIVKTWDSDARAMVETIWPSIGELRTTAMRTGEYAGRTETSFGEMITETIGGEKITFPEYAQVTVRRIVKGEPREFPGPRVYWKEAYASKKGGAPNAMWSKRPIGQLDKCAEAAALRGAFPEELGNATTAEEMEGQTIGDQAGATQDAPATGPDPRERPKAPRPGGVKAAQQEAKPAEKPEKKAPEKDDEAVDAEIIEDDQPTEDPPPKEPEPEPEMDNSTLFDDPEDKAPPKAKSELEEGETLECVIQITTMGQTKTRGNKGYVTLINCGGDRFDGKAYLLHSESAPPVNVGERIQATLEGKKTSSGTKTIIAENQWEIAK